MPITKKAVALLKGKGWNLYKGIPGAALPEIIAQGRSTTIERGAFYHVIPVAFRDHSFDEVADHFAYAHHTNQLPVYNDQSNPPFVVKGIVATDGGIAIVPSEEDASDGVLVSYEFDETQAELAITRYITNYNVHYFDGIDDVAAFVTRNEISPQTPSPLPGQLRWTFASRDENPEERVIYPANPSPILFRGQVKRYEPCLSTIVRDLANHSARDFTGLTQREQASLILNLIRTQWFTDCLEETPLFTWMKENKIHMNETAVAQHYGLPTGYIDLSQSFDVACFFACCQYDNTQGTWAAAPSGEGVIYVVDVRNIPLGHGPKPICLQPFPRPSEQWGWVHEVTLGDDFDNLPYVKKFIFRHNESSSRKILERFDHGRTLFPRDPLAVVADKIRHAKEVPLGVAQKSIQDLIDDPQGLPGAILDDLLDILSTEKNVTIVNRSVDVIDDRTRNEMVTGWAQRKDTFFKGIGIGFRVTRTSKSVPIG